MSAAQSAHLSIVPAVAEAPTLSREALFALPGLDALNAMIAGRAAAPSMAKTLGFNLAEVGEGYAVFEGEPTEHILNPMGIVHGGWALTLIDSAAGCAAHTTLAAGVGYTSVETKTNFVKAITPQTGRVRAEGRVIAAGKTIITTEAKITDDKGRVLAHGTSTIMVLAQR